MAKKTVKTSYTPAEVQQLRDRLHKEHTKELGQLRQNWYDQGKRDGKNELAEALRALLDIKNPVCDCACSQEDYL